LSVPCVAVADADRRAAGGTGRSVVGRVRVTVLHVQVFLLGARRVDVELVGDELGLFVLRDGLAVDDLGRDDHLVLDLVLGHRDLGGVVDLGRRLLVGVEDQREGREDQVQRHGHDDPRRVPHGVAEERDRIETPCFDVAHEWIFGR